MLQKQARIHNILAFEFAESIHALLLSLSRKLLAHLFGGINLVRSVSLHVLIARLAWLGQCNLGEGAAFIIKQLFVFLIWAVTREAGQVQVTAISLLIHIQWILKNYISCIQWVQFLRKWRRIILINPLLCLNKLCLVFLRNNLRITCLSFHYRFLSAEAIRIESLGGIHVIRLVFSFGILQKLWVVNTAPLFWNVLKIFENCLGVWSWRESWGRILQISQLFLVEIKQILCTHRIKTCVDLVILLIKTDEAIPRHLRRQPSNLPSRLRQKVILPLVVKMSLNVLAAAKLSLLLIFHAHSSMMPVNVKDARRVLTGASGPIYGAIQEVVHGSARPHRIILQLGLRLTHQVLRRHVHRTVQVVRPVRFGLLIERRHLRHTLARLCVLIVIQGPIFNFWQIQRVSFKNGGVFVFGFLEAIMCLIICQIYFSDMKIFGLVDDIRHLLIRLRIQLRLILTLSTLIIILLLLHLPV